MRRDIVHYYEKSIYEVFAAYRDAAQKRFGKGCTEEPYHTLSFGLNASFRYNMNGGSVNVHMIPYQTGTAVDVRYTIVQLAGARYGAYDKELTKFVCSLLGVQDQQLQLPIDAFLDPQNQVTPGAVPPNAAAQQATIPVRNPLLDGLNNQFAPPIQPSPSVHDQFAPPNQYVQQPARSETPNFCCYCGSRLAPGSIFCAKCGMRVN